MPGGDRKGPMGDGPKTGRGLGYCADNDQPSYPIGRAGRGFGRGRGQRGFSNTGNDQAVRSLLQQILDKLDKRGG